MRVTTGEACKELMGWLMTRGTLQRGACLLFTAQQLRVTRLPLAPQVVWPSRASLCYISMTMSGPTRRSCLTSFMRDTLGGAAAPACDHDAVGRLIHDA